MDQGSISLRSRHSGQVLILYVISAFLSFIQGYHVRRIHDITYRLRQDIATKINRLRFNISTDQPGEVLSGLPTTWIQSARHSAEHDSDHHLHCNGDCVFIMMLSISWSMTIVATLTIPLSILVIRFVVNITKIFQTPARISWAREWSC